MINFRKSIFLLFTIIFNGFSFAGDKVDRSLIVPETGGVMIEVTRGFVKVIGWDKAEILIQGELDDSVKELILKNRGEKSLIKVVPKGRSHWGDGSVLKIFIPRKAQLYFKGVDTTFSLMNLAAGVKGTTIKGDLLLKNVDKEMKISTVSGGVKVFDSTGEAYIESVNGKVDLSGKFSEVIIKSMSGDISTNISEIEELLIKNMSGKTTVKGQLQDDAEVKLVSVSGDIVYKTVGKLNAQCEIDIQFGGEINNKLTEDKPVKSRLKQKTLNFVSGDGSGSLMMNTATGSVTIEENQ